MLPLFFGTVSTFLWIRQCVIIYYKKWSFFSSFLFVYFFLLSLLFLKKAITSFDPLAFSVIICPLCLWLIRDIIHLKDNTFEFSTARLIFGSFFSLLALLFLSSVVLPHMHEHQAILKVEMTAEEKEDLITWKHPDGPLCSEAILRRRVIISTLDGKTVFDDFISGEMASVRIRQLTTPTWLEWMGLPSLWDADTISSDYLSMDVKKKAPIETRPLALIRKNVFYSFLWSFWEKGMFSGELPFPLGKSSLNSIHIPLVDAEGKTKKEQLLLHLSTKEPGAFTTKSCEEKTKEVM